MRSNKKGITLIALIIVIILMLILVGVTVSVALNGGLFKKAIEAKNRQQEEEIKEQVQVAMAMSTDERMEKYGKKFLTENADKDSLEELENLYGLKVGRKYKYVCIKRKPR